MDENDPLANDQNQDSTSSKTSGSPTDSDILRELAESMRNFWLDFEKYKQDNDVCAKLLKKSYMT